MAWFQISAAALLASMIIFLSINRSEQLQSSKGQTLLRIQNLLNNPSVLSSWNSTTDFCNMNPSLYSTVVCYNDSITQLHVIGNNGRSLLPKNFSIESLFTTLVSLPSLKVLTLSSLGLWGALPRKIARLSSLEILNVSSNYLYDSIPGELSSLSRLQSLVLDDNMFSGDLPGWIGTSFPSLVVLSMRKNMFNGTLPDSIGELENLRVLQLSHNYFHGEVPGLARLTNLQVLDLEDNEFGTEFPDLGNKLVTLVLSKNKFRDGLPHEISSFRQLQKLDVSSNNFVGPFPPLLLALPSISHLNIAANKLTGMLFENQSCSDELEFVDLSSNFLTGHLPNCLLLLQQQKKTVLLSNGNCLDARDGQNPVSYCRNEALAVGVIPQMKSSSKGRSNAAAVIALGVIGGVIGGIALVALAFLLVKKVKCGNLGLERRSTRTILEDASTGYPSKLLQDARYISQTMKLGTVGLPAYRAFSLEEIEAATNNFESSAFIGESSQGQMYKGKLKDGSSVAIRCVKMKRSHGTQTFTHQIERISKLRHRHLVSALGHCFECYLDDSSVSRVFLVFEHVQNGRNLRNWVSERHAREKLNWMQRLTAAIGVAKGIQFLHTGIVPGVSGNNLKITDVVLDQNLISKIRSYNLPLLADITGQIKPDAHRNSSAGSTQETKADVLDFGIILLEIIVGRPLESRIEVDAVKDQLQAVVAVDGTARRGMVDRDVRRGCSNQSLKTTMEICLRCLSKNPGDRPSFEDVLWNLQFAAQAQSGEVSPSSPFNII
ncbi:Probable inactive leucine-rich repeat receptor-like protein kinase At3g03770 [Linum perenne]